MIIKALSGHSSWTYRKQKKSNLGWSEIAKQIQFKQTGLFQKVSFELKFKNAQAVGKCCQEKGRSRCRRLSGWRLWNLQSYSYMFLYLYLCFLHNLLKEMAFIIYHFKLYFEFFPEYFPHCVRTVWWTDGQQPSGTDGCWRPESRGEGSKEGRGYGRLWIYTKAFWIWCSIKSYISRSGFNKYKDAFQPKTCLCYSSKWEEFINEYTFTSTGANPPHLAFTSPPSFHWQAKEYRPIWPTTVNMQWQPRQPRSRQHWGLAVQRRTYTFSQQKMGKCLIPFLWLPWWMCSSAAAGAAATAGNHEADGKDSWQGRA